MDRLCDLGIWRQKGLVTQECKWEVRIEIEPEDQNPRILGVRNLEAIREVRKHKL